MQHQIKEQVPLFYPRTNVSSSSSSSSEMAPLNKSWLIPNYSCKALKNQGHQLCRPRIEHVADGGWVSLFIHKPNRVYASMYSFFQPSRSSAESLYHCLQTREQWRRSTQSSCENIRTMRSVEGRSAGGSVDSISPPLSP